MEEKVVLLLEYMKKDLELAKKFDKEDGIDITSPDYKPDSITADRIEAFFNYRAVRTREAWLSKLYEDNEYKKKETPRQHQETMAELDAERRQKHNLALRSLIGLNRFGEQVGLPPFYEGEILTDDQITNYSQRDYDTRIEMTNFFLGFIHTFERMSLRLLKVNDKHVIEKVESLSKEMRQYDKDYGVKKGLVKDTDDISFKDFDR